MGDGSRYLSLLLACGLALLGTACNNNRQSGAAGMPRPPQSVAMSSSPLMAVLDQFTAADVPATGPAEIAVPALKPSTRSVPLGLPGNGLAQHPMLYAGEGVNTIFVVNGGKVVWTYSTGPGPEHDDVWMLSNGNILYSRMQYVAEISPRKQVVWRYDATEGKDNPAKHTEIHTCQPIGLDKVLFIENGLPPKLKVINIKTGVTEVDHELEGPQPAIPKNIHGEFRRVRQTAAGTYLVPYQTKAKVIEYDKDFKEIWRFDAADLAANHAGRPAAPTTKPARISFWAAIRLKNGNTLITDEPGRSQIEVTPDKKIVWELKPDDLPEPYRYKTTQTCTRLVNGNTIVCSRSSPQLVEVTPEKKVVWVLDDLNDLGPATSVQILDEPVVPEVPGESEH